MRVCRADMCLSDVGTRHTACGGLINAAPGWIALCFLAVVDANVELLLPRLPNNLPDQYKFWVPRPQFGAMINTNGKTSYGYAGVVWTLNILPQFFLEPMFGGAVHDGNATATPVPDENTLGCRVLFHTGLSGGYRLTERWTALLTWDHISNGHLCAHNAGMNDYGVKIGYSF